MTKTMQERFEEAKEKQLARSKEVKKETNQKKISLPDPEKDKKPMSAYHRKKYRDYLITFPDLKCGICQLQMTENTRFMHLDHCHTTGEIRGILCHNCNLGLGHFKDSVVFLEAAIDYLYEMDRKTKDKIKKPHPSWTTPIKSLPLIKPWWFSLPNVWIPT